MAEHRIHFFADFDLLFQKGIEHLLLSLDVLVNFFKAF